MTTAYHEALAHLRRRRKAEDTCPEHRWVYHSLYREGRQWNRKCSFCGKHETHWDDTPHANWPPPGARLQRDSSMPDEAWRELQAYLKALRDAA